MSDVVHVLLSSPCICFFLWCILRIRLVSSYSTYITFYESTLHYEFPLGTRSFQRLKNQTRPLPFPPRSRLEVFCSLLIQSLHLVYILTVGSALLNLTVRTPALERCPI